MNSFGFIRTLSSTDSLGLVVSLGQNYMFRKSRFDILDRIRGAEKVSPLKNHTRDVQASAEYISRLKWQPSTNFASELFSHVCKFAFLHSDRYY